MSRQNTQHFQENQKKKLFNRINGEEETTETTGLQISKSRYIKSVLRKKKISKQKENKIREALKMSKRNIK